MKARFAAVASALVGIACYIDFRDGLRCRNDGDCRGYVCLNSLCSSPDGGSSPTDTTLNLALQGKPQIIEGPAVSPGGTVHVFVIISNTGSSKINGVTGVLSTTAPGITIAGSNLTFGDIPTSSNACGVTTESRSTSCDQAATQTYPAVSAASSTVSGSAFHVALTLSAPGMDNYATGFTMVIR